VDIGYEQWIISIFVPFSVIGLEAESVETLTGVIMVAELGEIDTKRPVSVLRVS
jgi:hypothetical protein